MKIDLGDKRARAVAALAMVMRKSVAERSKLLGVKGDALAFATDVNRNVVGSPTMRAIDRYSGVLYGAMEIDSLSPQAKRRLDRSVVIFSGLFGLVAPGDAIPDYKLKMGASLPGIGKLSTFWRDDLSSALSAEIGGRQVWNLLPKEHDAAWLDPTGSIQTSVRFLEKKPDGSMVAVSHWNKFFKGALVRHLLEEPDTTPESLITWRHPAGWQLDPSLEESDGSRRSIAFVRDAVT